MFNKIIILILIIVSGALQSAVYFSMSNMPAGTKHSCLMPVGIPMECPGDVDIITMVNHHVSSFQNLILAVFEKMALSSLLILSFSYFWFFLQRETRARERLLFFFSQYKRRSIGFFYEIKKKLLKWLALRNRQNAGLIFLRTYGWAR